MFSIVNLETRRILTYKQGDRVIFASGEAAAYCAIVAQELTNEPHCVIDTASDLPEWWKRLPTQTAPWLLTV